MPKAAARAGAPSARSGDLERIHPQVLAVSKIHRLGAHSARIRVHIMDEGTVAHHSTAAAFDESRLAYERRLWMAAPPRPTVPARSRLVGTDVTSCWRADIELLACANEPYAFAAGSWAALARGRPRRARFRGRARATATSGVWQNQPPLPPGIANLPPRRRRRDPP